MPQDCITHPNRAARAHFSHYAFCDECAIEIERQDFRQAGDRFSGYLDLKRRAITGWLGNEYANLTSVRERRRAGQRNAHYWHATDEYGRSWHGRASGDGWYTTMMRSAR
jgi:hypothetical protein